MSFHPRKSQSRATASDDAAGRETAASVDRHWKDRWTSLALGAGLSPTEPVLLALSGGADSVYLLVALARAEPRPRVLAVHVDHRLRGAESEDDAAFCARLCAKLQVPFARCEVELDPEASNLEARAREARYRALADEARAAGLRTILTGHHEDDALETLLLRWMRGSALPGLAGLKPRNVLASEVLGSPGRAADALTVVRPLLSMRREEVRRLLRDAGVAWREDSSNESPRFTRNRVRNQLLPEIEETCGEGGFENLRAFASAVESLEEELAARTAHLSWERPSYADAVASSRLRSLVGGTIARERLTALAAPLQRRALWRLLTEGTGQAPTQALLAILEDDLGQARVTTRALPGGWRLDLRERELVLSPGSVSGSSSGQGAPRSREGAASNTPSLESEPSPPGPSSGVASSPSEDHDEELELPVPGRVGLPDGRVVRATWIPRDSERPIPRDPRVVELDARGLPDRLVVRTRRPGDRFHPLGAPGSRPLRRFLTDSRVPRRLRDRVLLVCSRRTGREDEVLWVAGLRPAEPRRLHPGSTVRLRLELDDVPAGTLDGAAVPVQDRGGETDLRRP